MQPPIVLPHTKDVVLIGGGHAHALVLKAWGQNPLAGARLTVINPGPTAPYSGMLPGFVAGHYERSALDIDLVKLGRFAGARVILGRAEGINLDEKLIQVPNHPAIAYDVVSIDVGITSDMPSMPGFVEHAVPAKPLGTFAAQWDRFRAGEGLAHIAVIGGGVAGAELILAMAHALRARERLGSATLIDSGQALTAVPDTAAKIVRNQMTALGVSLLENADIAEVCADHIRLSDGRTILSDFTTGAAGARPYDWLNETGLSLTNGFVDVDQFLRSSDHNVFATGDCAHLVASPRPKAGVYAVRQAPILFRNLRAAVTDDGLRPYKAQKDYLKLITLGGKSAMGEKFGLPFSGPSIWKWKNQIDQTFMAQFQNLTPTGSAELPPEYTHDLPAALHTPVQNICAAGNTPDTRPAVFSPAVVSTQHLPAASSDPVLSTKIAAAQALEIFWGSGATPQTAITTIILPRMTPALQNRSLGEIQATATEVMSAAGVTIVDSQSAIGAELSIGFTLAGAAAQPAVGPRHAQIGDQLILTKALGAGSILAAEMRGEANGDDFAAAVSAMTRPQKQAVEVLRVATAMTSVQSLGLLGHLQQICASAGCGATLHFNEIPVLPGAIATRSQETHRTSPSDAEAIAIDATGETAILFEPQICGGFLAVVSPDDVQTVLKKLRALGETPALIGEITTGSTGIKVS